MKTRALNIACIVVLAAAPFMSCAQAASSSSEPRTTKLISILQSNASLFEKARACQQLGEIGNRDAVPALAALLPDEHLSAYARSGLEGIPDPSAAAALREALLKLKGPLLIGVVNSLGALRDEQAVEPLRQFATDPGSGAINEALLALGNISSPESIRILEDVMANGSDATHTEAAAACLLAAGRQRTGGNLDQARRLYDMVRNAKVSIACRVGATRGAILSRTTDRVPFLIEQLNSEELAICSAALLTIREIPDDALASALNAQLARAKPELQRQLLLALADCHNSETLAHIEALASSASPELRTTALQVLGQLGSDAAPALLALLQKDLSMDDKSLVLNGLKEMPGGTVNNLLLQSLSAATKPGIRIELIRLLSARGAVIANGEILKHAAGSDKDVSLAALTSLQSLGGANEVPGLIALIKSSKDEAIRDAAENALTGACSRVGEPVAGAELVLTELNQAVKSTEKNCWMRVLAVIGYAKALPVIENAANDPDLAVAANALTQLGRWPDAAPMTTLLKALDTGSNPSLRKRALASVIDLATTVTDEEKAAEATIVGWMKRANSVAESIEDKRRILGILGHLRTIDSFHLLSSYLDDPSLRPEAAAGVIQIAPAVAAEADIGALTTALDRIVATVSTADLQDQARRAARIIRSEAKRASLFDGRSLAGWVGDTNVWRVREGVIVGGSMSGNPRNEFLVTLRSYTNFLLRLDYKLVGTEGFTNGGVQFRSVRVSNPPNEMRGYQADIGAGYSGCLYDESRRNTFLVRVSDETLKRLEKTGDWNRYEVRCEGTHLQVWLNGEKTVDYTETDATIPQEGLIGLQIHGGCKAEISFRNITIQEL